jgi:hypothetical protein
VLIIAILPIAQFFFGIWGLILATPVAVYVIYVVIFRQGLPGSERPREGSAARPSPRGSPVEVAPELTPGEVKKLEAARSGSD